MTDIINPDKTVMTHNADVYWHYAGDPVQRSQLLGTFPIGAPQKVLLPIPADANIVLRAVPRGGRGQTFMAGPADATPVTISALGVGTGGGTSNYYQQLRVNHGYSYGTTPTPRPALNLLQSFQIKDDAVFGESDLSTFGVPTGQLNLRTDKNASGQGAVTTATWSGTGSDIVLAVTLELQPGQGIFVKAAGVSGSDLVTTCLAVSADGKTITLNAGPFWPGPYTIVQADDTAAVQAWINAKGDLAMPPGYYRLTSSITLPPATEGYSIVIHGSGWDLSVFAFQGVGDGFVTDPSAGTLRFDSIVFKDCTIATGTIGDPNGTVSSTNRGHGLRMTAPGIFGIYDQLVLERVRVIGWGRFGLWTDNLEVSWLHDCIFRLNKSGHVAFIAPDEIGPNKQPNANVIDACTFDQAFSAADTKRTSTGSMTAGSNVLTLPSGVVNSTDRGVAVIVHGGGTSGAFIYSFIDEYISTTQVKLAYNAQATSGTVTVEIFPRNVSSIFLNRANDTTISGVTIQGNFAKDSTGANIATPLANDVNAIRADECGNLRIVGVHEEDNAGWGGAAIRLERCNAVSIENYGGTSADPILKNAHGQDIQIINSHGVRVSQCFFNDRPQFVVDGISTGIEIDNSLVTGHNNLWQHDSSWEHVQIGSGVHTQQRANQLTNQLGGSEYIYDSHFGRDLLKNGRFLDVASGAFESWTNSQPTWWSNPYSSLDRFGSYVKVNATAIADNGGIGTTILNQTVAIPDTLEAGMFTLAFDWYIENEAGSSSVSGRFTEVRLHPSSGIDEALQWTVRGFTYVQQRWQTAQMHCFLNAGSSRTIDVQINATPGPNNVIIRFANFRLTPGKHSFGSYERAVHDFGGRMRAPLEMVPISSATYPAPPTAGAVISLVNLAGVLNVGKNGVYSPITTGSSSGHIIQDETVVLPAEPVLNFTGGGIQAVDNPIAGNPRTDVTVFTAAVATFHGAATTLEGTVSSANQDFTGHKWFHRGAHFWDDTGGTAVPLVAQVGSVVAATAGAHVQEWWSTGVTPLASIDTQPILRLGIPGGNTGFLELCSASANTLKLACGATAPAQLIAFPNTFPSAGNVLQVQSVGAPNVQLTWGTAATGHTIMEEGGALIQRSGLNFVGAGITAADVAGNSQVTLNAATQTTEGIVSTVAQNFGGIKTFFAGAIMQGAGASTPVLTVQGQGASALDTVHIQEWKANGGIFSLGYVTITGKFRFGNPSNYTGSIELCSASSSNYSVLQAAATPAASLVYIWPANTPVATQVLGVSSIAGSTINLAWQTGGSGSGVGGNGTLNRLTKWTSASIPGTIGDAGIDDNGTQIVFQRDFLYSRVDGSLNLGDTTNRIGGVYIKNTLQIFSGGTLSTNSPISVGFRDSAANQANRWWMNGVGNAMQCGDGSRMAIYGYHAIELRGNRRSGTGPTFFQPGTDSSGVVIYQELTDVPPLVINSAFPLASSLLVAQNNTVTKFAITAAGSVWSEGGIRNAVALIQPAGGSNIDLTNYYGYHVLVLDTANGSFTVTLPLLTALNTGIRWRLVCNRRTSTATVTVKCQAGNDINETGVGGTTGWVLRPNTNNARDAIVVGDYLGTQQWWLANLIV